MLLLWNICFRNLYNLHLDEFFISTPLKESEGSRLPKLIWSTEWTRSNEYEFICNGEGDAMILFTFTGEVPCAMMRDGTNKETKKERPA